MAVSLKTTIILLFITSSCGGNKTLSGPVFILEPEHSVEFLNTEGTRLDCSVHGDPIPEIHWQRLNKHQSHVPVTDIPSLMNVYNNGSIVFLPFSSERYRQDVHASLYTCLASNIHGTIISSPVSIRADTRQPFQAKVYDDYVIRGNTAVFKCHIPAFQRRNLIVTGWIGEDNYIIRRSEPTGSRYIMTANGNLYIRHIKRSDQHKSYWCQVKNKLTGQTILSRTSGKIKLNEPHGSAPPKITDIIPEVSVMKGRTIIQLPCAAQGHPSPTYKWKLNDVTIQSTKTIGTLIVSETHDPRTTTYTCEVINNLGVDRSSTTVTVREHLQAYITPQQQVINTGQNIKLSCITSGYPIDKIEWRFNGMKLEENKRIKISVKNELRIEDVRREDRGMYQCFAENQWESVQGSAQLLLSRLKPSFIEKFKPIVKQPGPTLELICSATGIPKVNISWQRNGEEIIQGQRISIEESIACDSEDTTISRLTIPNINTIDGGLYSCRAVNEVGQSHHRNWVRVYGKPMVDELKNMKIPAGGKLKMHCYVSGYPIYSITWQRVGSSKYMPVGSKSFENGTLIIGEISRADAGIYLCTAKNKAGHRSYSIARVKVIAKPEVSPLPEPGQLSEGTQFTMICNVIYGDPPLTIKWLKNGVPITTDTGVEITKTKMYAVLQIRDLKGHHNGNYTCWAENPAGRVMKNVTLKVAHAPIWVLQPKNVTTILSSTVKINCQAKGYPSPKVRWFKLTGNEFLEMETKNRVIVHENGTLEISDLQKSDQAKFGCIASNHVLPNLVQEINLIAGAPPEIVNKIFVKTSNIDESVKLECKVSGDKPIRINWFKDGESIASNRSFNLKLRNNKEDLTESVIEIMSAQISHSGFYLCSANNLFGNENFTTSLEIKDPKATSTNQYPERFIVLTSNFNETDEIVDQESFNDSAIPVLNEVILAQEFDPLEAAAIKSKRNIQNIFGYNPIYVLVIPIATVIAILQCVIIVVILISSARRNAAIKRQTTVSTHVSKNSSDEEDCNTNAGKHTKSLDRNYGRLKEPDSTYQSYGGNISANYEIPDYYSGLKPYATLNLDSRRTGNSQNVI